MKEVRKVEKKTSDSSELEFRKLSDSSQLSSERFGTERSGHEMMNLTDSS